MLKVVTVVDKIGTALDRLAKGMAPYMENIDYHVIDVHPKRPDRIQLARFENEAKSADVIDWQYYRTAEMLRSRYDWAREIPGILVHNNPYAINESDWNSYQAVVGSNRTIYQNLKKITKARVEFIHHAVNPYFWLFNDDYNYERSIIMVANRIEGKKGILPVAKACAQIQAKLYLVGNISDMGYFQEVMATGRVQFSQNISDKQLRELYYRAGVHICNSVDNFESGTLPILEAMFCGVPVLSRKIGHVPDIYSGNNMVVGDWQPDDVQTIAEHLHMIFDDRKKIDELRNEGWFSIKHMNFERRAYAYQKLYREMIEGTPVSIITPVAGKEEVTKLTLSAIAEQSYKNIELIVIDDGEVSQSETVSNFAETVNFPVRYIYTQGVGYNLAKARNIGIIEATGEILVFCDQRMVMAPEAISEFVSNLKPKTWLYGNKGVKKEFVENFSCIYRSDMVTLGGFNERITQYGGLTQDIRSRARLNMFNLKFLESARADPHGKSANRIRRKYDIMKSKNILWKLGLN
jgi:glycosyltransferase involved in cell wall biosynthesis